MLKTIFDSISRIVLFSTWLYVVNKGQFSSAKTAFAYYSTAVVLMLFNAIFNNNRQHCSSKNWIGTINIFLPQALPYLLEIVMNSLSSVLSYNNFNFEPIFQTGMESSKNERKIRHESTLTKQTVYFLMFTALNAGYY